MRSDPMGGDRYGGDRDDYRPPHDNYSRPYYGGENEGRNYDDGYKRPQRNYGEQNADREERDDEREEFRIESRSGMRGGPQPFRGRGGFRGGEDGPSDGSFRGRGERMRGRGDFRMRGSSGRGGEFRGGGESGGADRGDRGGNRGSRSEFRGDYGAPSRGGGPRRFNN